MTDIVYKPAQRASSSRIQQICACIPNPNETADDLIVNLKFKHLNLIKQI